MSKVLWLRRKKKNIMNSTVLFTDSYSFHEEIVNDPLVLVNDLKRKVVGARVKILILENILSNCNISKQHIKPMEEAILLLEPLVRDHEDRNDSTKR